MKINYLWLLLISVFLLFNSCSNKITYIEPDSQQIEGHTFGEISRTSSIKILFAHPVGQENGSIVDSSVFHLNPKIDGQAKWLDKWTLEFDPTADMESGTDYFVTFKPKSIGFDGLDTFSFGFSTIVEYAEFSKGFLTIPNLLDSDTMTYRGEITTSDIMTPDAVEDLIKVDYRYSDISVEIDGGTDGNKFNFSIKQIVKQDKEKNLVLSLKGRNNKQHNIKMEIPGRDEFKLLDIIPNSDNEEYINLVFSQALDDDQDLTGLIHSENIPDLNLVQKSNQVKLYYSSKFPSRIKIEISSSVSSNQGKQMISNQSHIIIMPTEKPLVRFVGTGVIIPTSQGTSIPIETMNLNSIMVQAVKIHGGNVHQFLQVNDLNQNREINRVGEVVWQKVVDLDWDNENADKWMRYGLDISPLLEKDPSGFFQLKISFRRPHIQYACSGENSEDEVIFENLPDDSSQSSDSSYWDFYSNSNFSYRYRQHRNDPCHPAYYMKWNDHNINLERNVMISNVGLIANKDSGGNLNVFATDLRTGQPLSGVEAEVFNYQKRRLDRGVTNSKGRVLMELNGETPFSLLAEYNDQFGYLKLDEQSALSTSHFDISGVVSPQGIQGFIYGERGIWRPGDTMHLGFILYDPNSVLPDDHPVKFELRDPFGNIVESNVLEGNSNGFYYFPVTTSEEAKTGTWLAVFRVGSYEYKKQLKIESIMPNRIKIDLTFNSGKDYVTNGNISGILKASWLHGAIVSNLKSEIAVSFNTQKTTFPGYGDYVFDDPTRSFYHGSEVIFNSRLDETGVANFNRRLNISKAPGMLNATFTTRVFELSGVFSTQYTSYDFHPYEEYVGIQAPKGDISRGMLLTDTDHELKIVAVDRDGKKINTGTVKAEIFKLNWRWWWETDSENLSSYVSRRSFQPISSENVSIRNGKGSWKFRINYPDWGRYLLKVTDLKSGHITGKIVYIDWPGWAGRAQNDNSAGASMLVLNSDKKKYETGEYVNVSFPSNRTGRAIVTIESKGKILKSEWIEVEDTTTFYKFRATPSMAPNIYVHITYLQPHLQTLNDRPIRMYGIIPVMVENVKTHLDPLIDTGNVFSPGETVEIKVSEKLGRDMTYTLAIVDEGLLGITNFSVSNPWNEFFKKQASTLKTWDLYDLVAGAYTGRLNTLLAIGGGDGGEITGERKANRFEPVVIFEEPRSLRAGKTNTHYIKIPQYIGAVRVMVVAGNLSSFGVEEISVPVRKDIMVLGSLPRVLSPGDELKVPVTMFITNDRVKNVSLSISTEGPLTVVGSNHKLIRVRNDDQPIEYFNLKVGESTGFASVVLTAKGGGVESVHSTELMVRSPSPVISNVQKIVMQPGASVTKNIFLPGISGSNSLFLEISQMPEIDLSHYLSFLIKYPHGCIEQTTSSVFPQLFLSDLVKLTQTQKNETQKNIEAGLARLKQFQTQHGGFSYWPGSQEAHEWGTTYAGHFLIEAKKKGYFVSEDMYESWVNYQKVKSNAWYGSSTKDKENQAYRLYTLSLAGEPDLAAMNRLRGQSNLSNPAKWQLAMTYSLAGRRNEARSILTSLQTTVAEYVELSGTFGSTLRDKARILEAAVLLREDSIAADLALDISKQLSEHKTSSTQTIAYSLLAMTKYGIDKETNEPIEIEYEWNKEGQERVTTNYPILMQSIPLSDEVRGTLVLRNLTDKRLYPRIISRGIPAPGDEKNKSESIEIKVSYLNDTNDYLYVGNMPSGTDITAKVVVTNLTNRKLEELVLSHLVPSGWEIRNTRLSGGSSESESDYRDIRDDRIFTYFDLNSKQKKTFIVLANASYAGKFYLPAVSCEAMYDVQINAVQKGRWISIDDSKSETTNNPLE